MTFETDDMRSGCRLAIGDVARERVSRLRSAAFSRESGKPERDRRVCFSAIVATKRRCAAQGFQKLDAAGKAEESVDATPHRAVPPPPGDSCGTRSLSPQRAQTGGGRHRAPAR